MNKFITIVSRIIFLIFYILLFPISLIIVLVKTSIFNLFTILFKGYLCHIDFYKVYINDDEEPEHGY